MHPVLFEVGGRSVSSFGVMMAAGFLVGTWVAVRRMREEGFDPNLWGVLLVCLVAGGVLGSKLNFALATALREGVSPVGLLFRTGGMTWYGGFAGGALFAWAGTRFAGASLKQFADSVCIGLAVGQAIGRVGCLLVGDDYGRPTDLPIGIAFPEGAPPTTVPVHPTQIYEMLWLLAVAGFLWRFRAGRSPFLCAEYIALHATGRIAIEQLRVNPPLALGLSEAQWIGVGLIVYAAASWLYYARRGARSSGTVAARWATPPQTGRTP